MKLLSRLHPPGGDRTWQAALMTVIGVCALTGGLLAAHWLVAGLGVLFLAAGIGLWKLHRWALWLSLVLCAQAAVTELYAMSLPDASWWRFLTAFSMVWLGWQIWKHFRPVAGRRQSAQENDDTSGEPVTSLVWLLRTGRTLSPAIIAEAAEAAWGTPFRAVDRSEISQEDEESSTGLVAGNDQIILIKAPAAIFSVLNLSEPYIPEREQAAESIGEVRRAEAVRRHTAWCSCDLTAVLDESRTRESFYSEIAKLMAELAEPDNCLALIEPRDRRIAAWHDEMPAMLRSDHPLLALTHDPLADVIPIPADDQILAGAVREARENWPQFADTFRKGTGRNFTVKAPVSSGDHREYIWIDVDALHDEYLEGRLANEPVRLGALELGSRIEVPVSEVMDWCYEADGDLHGLFTPQALARIRKEAEQKKKS